MSDKDAGAPENANISTEHQTPGDAKRPADTLDRDAAKSHPARDFDPATDAGKPQPD